MKLFLSISAGLAWLFGLASLFSPALLYAPLGIVMTPAIATIAQAQGASLIGLGCINWFARNLTGQVILPVLAGNLVVQIVSLGVIVYSFLTVGSGDIPGIVIHIILGGFFLYFFLQQRKKI